MVKTEVALPHPRHGKRCIAHVLCYREWRLCGRNSVVECSLPKADVVGSNPIARSCSPVRLDGVFSLAAAAARTICSGAFAILVVTMKRLVPLSLLAISTLLSFQSRSSDAAPPAATTQA